MSPHLKWTGMKGDTSMLRVWGCMVWYYLPTSTIGKFASRARWGIHLGISREYKAWLILDLISQKFTKLRDVIFYERLFLGKFREDERTNANRIYASDGHSYPTPEDEAAAAILEQDTRGEFTGDRRSNDDDDEDPSRGGFGGAGGSGGGAAAPPPEPESDDDDVQEVIPQHRHDSTVSGLQLLGLHTATSTAPRVIEPKNPCQALTGPYNKEWREAMDVEIRARESRDQGEKDPLWQMGLQPESNAATAAVREGLYLQELLQKAKIPSSPTFRLHCGNQSAIRIANKPGFVNRTKHIVLRYFFVKDEVDKGKVDLTYCPTGDMAADFLTKRLSPREPPLQPSSRPCSPRAAFSSPRTAPAARLPPLQPASRPCSPLAARLRPTSCPCSPLAARLRPASRPLQPARRPLAARSPPFCSPLAAPCSPHTDLCTRAPPCLRRPACAVLRAPPCCPACAARQLPALLRAALLAGALLPGLPCCCPPCSAPPCWPPCTARFPSSRVPPCLRATLLVARHPALPAMASLSVLTFDHDGRPILFDTWLDELQLYLLSDSKDSVLLFDHTSGASLAAPATADSATRSYWLTRDAAARLAVHNHLSLAECAHFGQHKTAKALYDAVVARYSSLATATLGCLILPYLFLELLA
ncbi:unnamed protein product [Closterium sp. NIES-53]